MALVPAAAAPLEDAATAEERRKREEAWEAKLKKIQEATPSLTNNKAGSQAGAGSGEFHTYRKARNRELARLEALDAQATEKAKATEYEERRAALEAAADAKTAKNRAKRQAKKDKRKRKREEGDEPAPAPS